MGDIKKQITFIDLFSGCGGISLGFKWAGLAEVAAIDFNRAAVNVFKANFPENEHVYCEDLRSFPPEELAKRTGLKHVDIIVGGPPCQGFSTVRQRDGSNSGLRLIDDDRRDLYKEFLKYVNFYQPEIFVIENVPGIKTAAGGHFFNQVQSEARSLGYRVHSEVVKAWEYGVPQKRIRRLIIGAKVSLSLFTLEQFVESTHSDTDRSKQTLTTLWEAIGDLPPVIAGGGSEIQEYDFSLRQNHIEQFSGRYTIDVLACDKVRLLTHHKARPHSVRDLRDFSRLNEGENSGQAIKRGEQMEFPYDRNSFKDRFTRQRKDGLCSTILAHLSKDGLMFIHPTQNRSLTPREAARIQSFPDTFVLPVPRTDQYKLIGNAVPPLVGFALGKGITRWLMVGNGVEHQHMTTETNVHHSALNDLIAYSECNEISEIPIEIFKRGWQSIHFFLPNLHPASALENGDAIVKIPHDYLSNLKVVDPKLVELIYKRSGWPVLLVKFAKEARRRYAIGSMTAEEYYWGG